MPISESLYAKPDFSDDARSRRAEGPSRVDGKFDDERAFLDAAKEETPLEILRVGLPGDYRPFAIKDPYAKSGYAGHDVALLEALARLARMLVVFVPTSWQTLSEDLAHGRIDVAAGGLSLTADRTNAGRFLPAYASVRKVALVRKALAEEFSTPDRLNQPDVRVVKNPGGTNERWVDKHLGHAHVSLCTVNEAIPGLVADGMADVMITDNFEARWYAEHDDRLAVLFDDDEHALSEVQQKAVLVSTTARTRCARRAPLYERLLIAWQKLAADGTLAKLRDEWLVDRAPERLGTTP